MWVECDAKAAEVRTPRYVDMMAASELMYTGSPHQPACLDGQLRVLRGGAVLCLCGYVLEYGSSSAGFGCDRRFALPPQSL